jgi:single-stranded DNA-binding protein
MNLFVLKGRLTRDPELKVTQNGKSYTFFTVAHSYKDTSSFFPVKLWGQSAEFLCTYGTKGQEVVVSGRLSYYEPEPKKGVITLDANDVCLGRPSRGSSRPEPVAVGMTSEDDILF